MQRAAGNAATSKAVRPAAQDRFRVVIVPDGEQGLSHAAVTRALTVVRQGLAAVTSGSHDPIVRRGFSVEYRESEGDLGDLHHRVLLVYLMPGRDADRAVELAAPHLPRGYGSDLKDAAHELSSIGGTNLRVDFDNGKSPSVSLVSTGALAEFVHDRPDGERLGGLLLGEVILHELGHALRAGHDHGIMEGHAVFDATTLGRARHFSSDSLAAMRSRLEYLARH
jgi:hypothetical protein